MLAKPVRHRDQRTVQAVGSCVPERTGRGPGGRPRCGNGRVGSCCACSRCFSSRCACSRCACSRCACSRCVCRRCFCSIGGSRDPARHAHAVSRIVIGPVNAAVLAATPHRPLELNEREQAHDHDGLRPSEPPWMCTFGRYGSQRRAFTPSELLPNDAKRTAHRPRHACNAQRHRQQPLRNALRHRRRPCDTAGDLATPPTTFRHRRRPL